MSETLGSHIRKGRKYWKMSVKQLASLLGVSEKAVRMFESDKEIPDDKTLTEISDRLGCDLNEMLRLRGGGNGMARLQLMPVKKKRRQGVL